MVNRLSQSPSLYLQKHAENPIDWWPWCDQALTTARQENKPIFLSIGYSSCHWCTVMEGEAFSHLPIAEYMNANFLPIKVDREERPDIDSIYMQALQMMTGQGGWPLNIFLTPEDLIPFYGGTYFPIEPRYGRPGFLEILQAIRRFYDVDKTKLAAIKEEILDNLKPPSLFSPSTTDLTPEVFKKGVEVNTIILSDRHSQNSFPMIPYGQLALAGIRFNLSLKTSSEELGKKRGLDLALGGIFDHIAGGFHRYTVDPNWTVPHFEKMLYDNGQIVEFLANLWTLGIQEPAFQRAITKTVEWLKREMTAPEGYFYAAQDADSFITGEEKEPEEGAFYVWSFLELEEILTPSELQELQEQFTLTLKGNFEGKNVLQRYHTGELNSTVEKALEKLFKQRYGTTPDQVKTFPPASNNREAKQGNWPGRIPPVTDTKMIVAWNSLMISGLARSAIIWENQEYLGLAIKATQFILNQRIDGRLYRLNYGGKSTVFAQSEDYALLIKALLDLQQASLVITSDIPSDFWLDQAIQLQEEFDEYLWSIEMGGYYNAPTDTNEDLIIKERSYMDNATPSANGIAITSLIRLALLTENLQYLDRAEEALKAFGGIMKQYPHACPTLFLALDWYKNSTLVRSNAPQILSLLQQYYPTIVYQIKDDLPEGVIGLVCQGLTCKEPATTPTQLLEQIRLTMDNKD